MVLVQCPQCFDTAGCAVCCEHMAQHVAYERLVGWLGDEVPFQHKNRLYRVKVLGRNLVLPG